MVGHLTETLEAATFVETLERDGFELQVDRGRLRIRPVDRVTDALRRELERHKAAIVVLRALVSRYVVLKGGLTVPAPALLMLWAFEDRGFQMSLDANGQFVIAPIEALTESDRAGIARWRRHLAALVSYEAPEVI